MTTEIVWFKRDLRVEDHAPLARAAARGPVLPLYVFETDLLAQPDASVQHAGFVRECLAELDDALRHRGVRLVVRQGVMPEVLEALANALGPVRLWSHEETGNGASFARDRRVKAWCRARGVEWIEIPQHGVVRGLRDRDLWSAAWDRHMSAPRIDAPGRIVPARGCAPDSCSLQRLLAMEAGDKADRQPGGRALATDLLESFLAGRGTDYRVAMSSPLSAEDACSRLRPHRGYDGLREEGAFPGRLDAWRRGETGYPFVDACMRKLAASGWINFRMRAMLVSFASYQLWLHWREPALHLAREFLDYEPGIHYPQVQM